MAIKISGTTVIDNSQNITNAGIVTATSFTGDGSQLTNLPGGGGNTLEATASGTLEDGSKVIVNADGTVSVVSQSETTGSGTGSAETFSSLSIHASSGTAAVYDSTNNRVIVAFCHRPSSTWLGRAVVGTVNGSSITFGSAVQFSNDYVINLSMAYDSTNDKVVIAYAYNGAVGTAVVGEVNSGTNSITFGSQNTFYNNSTAAISVTYDPDTDRFPIMYSAAGNTWGLVAIVSGTSISYGSATSAEGSEAYRTSATYDTHNNRVVIAYVKNASAPYLYRAHCRVATVTGGSTNTISFGNATDVNGTNQTFYIDTAFDSSANKVIVAYKNYTGSGSAHQGYVQVGTVNSSNNTISLGSQVAFETAEIHELAATFDSTNNKVVIAFANASLHGKVITGTVSGTSISFDTATTFHAAQTNLPSIVFDSNSGNSIIAYKNGNGDIGDAKVFVPTGFPVPQTGSTAVFESAQADHIKAVYDSANGKVVIAYQDRGGYLDYGTAVVGTVSGTSISFGTPAVFESASTSKIAITYTTSGKVVIAYRDNGNSYYGTAIVGTVSGTSISFGSPTVYQNTGQLAYNSITYDSSKQKVVVAYQDPYDAYGKARVGTVSGTSISFGSPVTFESADTHYIAPTFDSTNNKVVIAYKDNANSGRGTAIVGEVSGTSISFPSSPVVFESGEVEQEMSATFDSTNGKVVIAYADGSNSYYGTAAVGEVSGTGISFGTPVVFESSSIYYISAAYESDNGKVIIAFKDNSNSHKATAIVGTVSGTSISFDSPNAFVSTVQEHISAAYDSVNRQVVIAFNDKANSKYGTAFTFSSRTISRNLTAENFIGISDGAYSDGQTATIQLTGAVDDAQSSLTPGQAYYVQNDGTLSETADNPSVFAGTALASTKLIVRG